MILSVIWVMSMVGSRFMATFFDRPHSECFSVHLSEQGLRYFGIFELIFHVFLKDLCHCSNRCSSCHYGTSLHRKGSS